MAKAIGAVGISIALGLLACGPAPTSRPSHLPENAVRVVPADQVKGTCACDDDDDFDDDAAVPPQKPVEYVQIDQWPQPPAVRTFEERHPPRGAEPSSYTQFPKLTLHRPIGESSIHRYRRFRGLR